MGCILGGWGLGGLCPAAEIPMLTFLNIDRITSCKIPLCYWYMFTVLHDVKFIDGSKEYHTTAGG